MVSILGFRPGLKKFGALNEKSGCALRAGISRISEQVKVRTLCRGASYTGNYGNLSFFNIYQYRHVCRQFAIDDAALQETKDVTNISRDRQ